MQKLVVAGVILGLFSWVFADVIFRDRNFSYRDAGHFYYPLLKLVQDEWHAGRWPLWNPYENGGMPLLGNPASAVLYPPRVVIFQWLPISYATAYKSYTLLHVLLSALTAYAMARNWRASECAAGLAAISYAFGAVIMFQYCNVIFLVGAAWVPLALLAIDRMLRAGCWRWATLLGVTLALQMLGGDPEAAYLTGGLAAFYVVLLNAQFGIGLAGMLGLVFLGVRLLGSKTDGSPGDSPALVVLAVALVVIAPVSLWWMHRRRHRVPANADERRRQRARLGCLAIAALVAVGVSAVQWIPTWEFNRISLRAVGGGIHHEPYAFWVAPWRLVEMVWPNVSGHQFPINSRWMDTFAAGDRTWEPSLYFGAFPLVLAISAWGVRQVPSWQRWISLSLVLSLWAAMGPAGGLSWYWKMAHDRTAGRGEVQTAGPIDPTKKNGSESEPPTPQLETPAGGLYWFMVRVLPGFASFRYPAKLMTFAAAAFAALAAVGWDRMFSNQSSRHRFVIGLAAVVGLMLALAAYGVRPSLANWFGNSWSARGTPYYGPLQPDAASWCIVRALATTAVGLLLVCVICTFSRGRLHSQSTAATVLLIVAVDIGLANRWLVSTAAQQSFDAVPRVTAIIEEAEAAEPSPGPRQPFRIHRVAVWSPPRWFERIAADQDEEVFRWEKDTIQPKYGLLKFGELGRFSYAICQGTTEPYDYWWFFAPFYSNTTSEPRSVVYHPIRGYEMWGAKYFVLPKGTFEKDEHRSLRTFLQQSELIGESDMGADDFQVRRNLSYFPRAWIVHRLIYRTPIRGLVKADRMNRMREILYPGFDGQWREPTLEGAVQDPREVAWIEHPDPAYVAALQSEARESEPDRCRIVRYEPDRVEIEVETDVRGVMVLADLFLSGWELTVDDQPTEILRANRIMRGAPIGAGKHRIVFVYNPLSFRVGGWITSGSVLAALITLLYSRLGSHRQPFQTTVPPVAGVACGEAVD